MYQPEGLAAEHGGKGQGQDGRPDQAAGEADCQGFAGAARALPVGYHQQPVTGEREAAEVCGAALVEEGQQFGVVRVEQGIELAGEKEDQHIAVNTHA